MQKKIGIIGMVLILLGSCGKNADSEKGYASTREGSRVILTVENEEYTNADYRAYVTATTGQEFNSLSPEALKELIHSFVEEKLLLRAAEDAGVALTSQEKQKYLKNILRDESVEISADETAPAASLLDKYLIEKFTAGLIQGISVSPEEVEEYYQAHKRDFLRPERVKVSQILLKTQEKAVEALEKVKRASEEMFREVARNMSEGVEASRGGIMGIFSVGQLPSEMDKVIFQLKKGEISPIVESAYGYHIFRLDEKREQQLMTLEEAAPEIEKRLLNQKVGNFMEIYVKKMKENTQWSFFPDRVAMPEIKEEE